ncbi:hypothetical protein MMC21_007800 [Puttea exsequens]|nr:hypothetical protein [Puttea exsequens]
MAVQQQLRRLVINQAVNTPRSPTSLFKAAMATIRPFTTTTYRLTSHDASTIDFAYMPSLPPSCPPVPEISRVPLLPYNFKPSDSHGPLDADWSTAVIRPEIHTVSANGTHIESPSSMHEVADSGAQVQEMDVFRVGRRVGERVGEVVRGEGEGEGKGEGVVRGLLRGVMQDVLGNGKGRGVV